MAAYTDESLFQALNELGIISPEQLKDSYDTSQKDKRLLSDVLLDRDLLSDENLGRTISDLTSLPLIRLQSVAIPDDILHIIPEVVARKRNSIAFKKDEKGLHLAMVDPSDLQTKEFIKKKVGTPVIAYIATPRDVASALYLYRKDVKSTFDDILHETVRQASNAGKHVEPPIIKIVDTILSYSYQNKASDVHIEPQDNASLIRFRIDGILHDIAALPLELHKPVVTRIKVLSDLRTDEHQAAQDGKLHFQFDNEGTDVRVSVVPIKKGEKVVMRLLSERSRQMSLTDLGLAADDLAKVRKAYEKPYGMILSTGPTGSGKTTSVYAVLKLLNKRDVNIMTIEDPVEYDIEGINQIQVNVKTNLTFAEGLRSIVRQDPNIILVGEIRDHETADIAINSAMTGHLVLSTVHTNDAATTIPRLFEMGIEPFLVASTVNVIIAQRLVRKIHNGCRISEEVPAASLQQYFAKDVIAKAFGKQEKILLYRGKGCQVDHNIGYEGRLGIFEVLVIDDQVRAAIVGRKDAAEIRKIAMKNGMRTMLEDGLEKAKQGLTTIEEIMRVTKE